MKDSITGTNLVELMVVNSWIDLGTAEAGHAYREAALSVLEQACLVGVAATRQIDDIHLLSQCQDLGMHSNDYE